MESQERVLHELHRCRIAATSLYRTDSPPEFFFHRQIQEQSRLPSTFRNFSNSHGISMTCLLLRFKAPCQQALLRGPSFWIPSEH